MAITQNPLIGRASGKYSTSIFTKNFNKNIVKSKELARKDKKSDTQLTQRSKFTAAQQFAILFQPLIAKGFKPISNF